MAVTWRRAGQSVGEEAERTVRRLLSRARAKVATVKSWPSVEGSLQRMTQAIIQVDKPDSEREATCLRLPSQSVGRCKPRTAVSGQALFHFTTINCSMGEPGRESSS